MITGVLKFNKHKINNNYKKLFTTKTHHLYYANDKGIINFFTFLNKSITQVTTAANGLNTPNANTVYLGGTLLQDTCIDLGTSYVLHIVKGHGLLSFWYANAGAYL